AMTRQYFYLTQLNVSCKNRYKRLINICFPEFEEIFKGSRIYEETALNIMYMTNRKMIKVGGL
ncbi:MAG: hypothetical protein MR593_11355, partial [Intestinibacter sp.]|uniref:hypothetical protein n=1 Tax=Intestinibacter sp. TaxID=1965304 RepID=UPI0025C29459